MKKILLLPILSCAYLSICDLSSWAEENLCSAIHEIATCAQVGCEWDDYDGCSSCPQNYFGSGGVCRKCDTLGSGNYEGYWNKTVDTSDTPKQSSACYGVCSEDAKKKLDCDYYNMAHASCIIKTDTSSTPHSPNKCQYSFECDNGYYPVDEGNKRCAACSDLTTKSGTSNYWMYTGHHNSRSNTRCHAECSKVLPKAENGIETYENNTPNFPSECIPKTCQNSTNKCEGYKLVTPYSCPNDYVLIPTLSTAGGTDGAICEYRDFVSKKTIRIAATKGTKGCFRYTKEQATGFPEGTNAAKGYTILNETSGTYPTLRIYECATGYHLQTPRTTDSDHCTKREYGTCISDTGKCNADLLDCTGGSTNTISGTNITWNADKEDWDANTGCKCVSTGVTLYNNTGNEIGTATITKTYASGDKNNGNTKWNDAEINVTRCILGYAAQDGTCKPVKDGQYSADNDPVAHECSDVEVCLSMENNGCAAGGKTKNYYQRSKSPRDSANDCYVECSNRVKYLNATQGTTAGTWQLMSTSPGTVTKGDDQLCLVELSCKAGYYQAVSDASKVESSSCNFCRTVGLKTADEGYWNNSDGGTGGPEQCYALCNDSNKKPTTDNGEFTAGASKVNYNATTKAKCTYTLGCKAGFYTNSDGKSCGACPAGSTSDAGSTDIKQCYMKGGKDGTLFCDKHGCFNLPTGVQIYYASD